MHVESREVVERYDFLKGIVEFIAMNPSTTIPVIVKSTGYSYTAVKHAADELIKKGILKSERKSNSKRGRPASYLTLYKPFMIVSPPRQYLYLSKMIMQGLVEKMGVDGAKNFFSQLGEKTGIEAAKSLTVQKKMTTSEVAQAIEKFMNEYGAYSKTSVSHNNITVTLRNCIFYEISKEYEGIVCEAHNTFFKSFFKAIGDIALLDFSHEECMAKGSKCCKFRLQISA